MSANYWIAQHISDLFRNEPKNVGVFVKVGDRMASKFFGEGDDTQIDGRKLKSFPYPDVYKQWVDYWKEQLSLSQPDELVNNSGSHYRVVEAGEITDYLGDTAEDIANYLYALIVSEGGLREALGTEEELAEEQVISLEADLTKALRAKNLLGSEKDLFVAHPVRRGVTVQGQQLKHKPAFVQKNGSLYVMETVDFTITQKVRSRDHAGWSAYMFKDIRSGNKPSENIAIVRVRDEEKDIEDVFNGLAALKNEADIVNWLDEKERNDFIESRRNVAVSH